MAFHEIPTVSLADWHTDPTAFADRLRAICHDVGFFRVVDHGVDPVFLDDYFAAMRSFFALPEALKAQIDKIDSPWFRGWERVGAELTDNNVDHREQIDVWTELDPRPPDVAAGVPAAGGPQPVARRGHRAGLPPPRRALPGRDGRDRRRAARSA